MEKAKSLHEYNNDDDLGKTDCQQCKSIVLKLRKYLEGEFQLLFHFMYMYMSLLHFITVSTNSWKCFADAVSNMEELNNQLVQAKHSARKISKSFMNKRAPDSTDKGKLISCNKSDKAIDESVDKGKPVSSKSDKAVDEGIYTDKELKIPYVSVRSVVDDLTMCLSPFFFIPIEFNHTVLVFLQDFSVCSHKSPSALVNQMMDKLFSVEEMCTYTLTGRGTPDNKNVLDTTKVQIITGKYKSWEIISL